MNNLQLPEVKPSASAVVTRRSVKRRIDPIDAPARPLGSKRLALIAKRTNAAASTSDRHAERLAAGDTLLANHDGTVTFLLCATRYGLLMERTQRQASGMRLVQTMVFHDVKSVSVRQSHLEIDPVSRHRVHDEHHAHYGERHDRPAPQAALLLPGT